MLEAGCIRMLERLFSRARIILLILLPIIILLVVGGARILAPQTPALVMIYPDVRILMPPWSVQAGWIPRTAS